MNCPYGVLHCTAHYISPCGITECPYGLHSMHASSHDKGRRGTVMKCLMACCTAHK